MINSHFSKPALLKINQQSASRPFHVHRRRRQILSLPVTIIRRLLNKIVSPGCDIILGSGTTEVKEGLGYIENI